MRSFDWLRLCSASWPRSSLQLMLAIFLFFISSSESLSCFRASKKDGGCLCCVSAVPVCCSTHANRTLTNQKRIAFLHGAITLAVYLFMKALLTFSMDGPTIIKTWACCSEREDSSWFLLDLASLTFCLLKHLGYWRFWKTGKNLPIDVFSFCFAMSQSVTTGLFPTVYSWIFHRVHLRLQVPLISRGMVPICCFPFPCCFSWIVLASSISYCRI